MLRVLRLMPSAEERQQEIESGFGPDAVRFTTWATAHAGETVTVDEPGLPESSATLLGWYLNYRERSMCAVFMRHDWPILGEVMVAPFACIEDFRQPPRTPVRETDALCR